MPDRLETIRQRLESHGQSHLLQFADELGVTERAALLEQIEGIDFIAMDELIRQHVSGGEAMDLPADLSPAAYYPCDDTDLVRPYDAAEYRARGEELLRAGKVAAFTVAGGQGTRLGWNGPKGTYPATVVTGKPLFRCFAEQILAAQKKYSVTIPWYIMTSVLNDVDTRSFFLDNNHFGLPRQNICFFRQGLIPSIDAKTGELMLEERHAVALSPDGHGGSIRALAASGSIEDMRARGIEHISYFQVDNPLVKVIDPLFIGLHAAAPDSSAEMSSKMVAKTDPAEKVGVLCRADGKTMVIEYSDLPEEYAGQRDESGRLRYNAGSIAVHIIGVAFVQKLTADEHRFALPYHRAVKKVAYIDRQTGRRVEPEQPNGVKFETFVFDALPLAESSIVLETDRVEEFAPIKNASGADSVATSHQLQSERAGRWLEAHGVNVPRDRDGRVSAKIEISPLTALQPEDLVPGDLPRLIEAGEEIVL